MAVLSNADRQAAYVAAMQKWSDARTTISITKAELRAAINAVDDWVDTNAAVYNLAIPQPARSALTAQQKAEMLVYVVRKRAGEVV